MALEMYASGNGALSFVHLVDKQDGVGGKVASGQTVTKEQCEALIASLPADDKLKSWWLLNVHGNLLLVHPVKRLGPDKVEVDGKVYTYELEPWSFIALKSLRAVDFLTFEVLNQNTRQAVTFFLRNEEYLPK